MLKALENEDYDVYELDITQKLWHESSSDSGGFIHYFYAKCGDLTFTVTEVEYERLTDKLIVLLLKNGKKTLISTEIAIHS